MTSQELEECKDVFLSNMFEQPPEPLAQWAQKYGFNLIEHIEKLEGEHCIEMAIGQQQLDALLNENAALKRVAETRVESAPNEASPSGQNGFLSVVAVGRLGATVPEGASIEDKIDAALSEAEDRILNLERRVHGLADRQKLFWGSSQ